MKERYSIAPARTKKKSTAKSPHWKMGTMLLKCQRTMTVMNRKRKNSRLPFLETVVFISQRVYFLKYRPTCLIRFIRDMRSSRESWSCQKS